jgi:hypothetical protein
LLGAPIAYRSSEAEWQPSLVPDNHLCYGDKLDVLRQHIASECSSVA